MTEMEKIIKYVDKIWRIVSHKDYKIGEKAKYPKQIFSALTDSSTIGIDAELTVPLDGKSPLEMHSPFSRFVLTILTKSSSGSYDSVMCNIPVGDIPHILKQYEHCSNLLFRDKKIADIVTLPANESGCDTDKLKIAQSATISMGKLKGLTPAEAVKKPENVETLKGARKIYESNLAKYPGNSKIIAAIDAALELSPESAANVAVASHQVEVYTADYKYLSSKADKEGRPLVYNISITCNTAMRYPYTITVQNCFAYLRKNSKGLDNPDMKSAVNVRKMSVMLSEKDFDNMMFRLRNTIDNFERANFETQYNKMLDMAWKKEDK